MNFEIFNLIFRQYLKIYVGRGAVNRMAVSCFGKDKNEVNRMANAKVGEIITFKRDGESHEGSVTGVRENSVIVQYGYSKEKDEPLTTIVNHKNYKIKK